MTLTKLAVALLCVGVVACTKNDPPPAPTAEELKTEAIMKEAKALNKGYVVDGAKIEEASRNEAVRAAAVVAAKMTPERLALRKSLANRDNMLNHVKERLKDPFTVQFQKVTDGLMEEAVLPNGAKIGSFYEMCGEINAKNSYGGYIGFKPFVAVAFEEKGEVTYGFWEAGGDDDPLAVYFAKKIGCVL